MKRIAALLSALAIALLTTGPAAWAEDGCVGSDAYCSPSPTSSDTPTESPSPTESVTPSPSESVTPTPTPSDTPSETPTPSESQSVPCGARCVTSPQLPTPGTTEPAEELPHTGLDPALALLGVGLIAGPGLLLYATRKRGAHQ